MNVILDPATLDDVFECVGESLYSDQIAAAIYGDEMSGLVYTIGQTSHGVLFGLEENGYGQRAAYRFGTEQEQDAWFEAVTGDIATF